MHYIFSAVITACIALTIISSKKRLWAGLLLSVLAIIMIVFPSDSLMAAKDGMNLWLFVVVPSLLPFFILNDMMVALDVPKNISHFFSPISRLLFNSSGYGAYAFIMSIFSGYPAGAKITSTLIRSGQISSEEGQRILSFSSTSGPLFIIGAVGSGMLKSSSAGYLLFFSHIMGAILNGMLYNIASHKTPKAKKDKISFPSFRGFDPSGMLGSAISSSLITCGYIGGYIVLFSVIIKLLNKIGFFSLPTLSGIGRSLSMLLQGCFEISSGSSIISSGVLPMEVKLILLSFIIGFGGLSILGQVSTVISGTGIRLGKYALFKLTQGILSALTCFVMLKTSLFTVPAFSSGISPEDIFSGAKGTFILFEALLVLLLLLNLTGYAASRNHSKHI